MFWTHWHEEGMQEGMQQGIQQGMQEGMQQGMQQGMQREALGFVVRLARRRFGAPVDALSGHLALLSTQQLEDLGEALIDFTSVADLERWLDRAARVS